MSAPTRAPSVILAPIHVLEDLSVSLSVRRGTLPSLLIVSKAGEVQPSTAPIPGFRVTRLSVNVSSGKLVLAWRMTYQLHPRERMQQPSKGWPMTSGPSLSLLLLCSCFDWFYDCQNIQKNLCDWEETWNKVVIKIENYWQINWYCTTFAECTSEIIARKTIKKMIARVPYCDWAFIENPKIVRKENVKVQRKSAAKDAHKAPLAKLTPAQSIYVFI